MSLLVTCPKCNSKIKVSDDLVGRDVKCPKCHTTFRVPTAVDDLALPIGLDELQTFPAIGPIAVPVAVPARRERRDEYPACKYVYKTIQLNPNLR